MARGKLLKLIKGYIIIRIDNDSYEKTLNLLRRKGILIWDINKTDNGISFKIYYEDYIHNRELFYSLEANTMKKHGVLFKLKKLISRKGFILGAILIFAYIVVYCSYIWEIEVIGNDNIKDKEIITALEENNYKPPFKIGKLDKEELQGFIYNNFDQLKFVEAYVEGTKLVIFVKEKKKVDIYYAEDYPASIIATKPAVINKLLIKQGSTIVQEGDVVKKGQTLVEGFYIDHNGVQNLVHAEGSIIGETYYNIVLEEPKVQSRTVETGKTNKIYTLFIGENKIKLFGKEDAFNECDDKVNIFSIPLISNKLNVYIECKKQYEIRHNDDIASRAFIENKMRIEMYETLRDMCSDKSSIYKENIVITESEDKYMLNAKIEMLEDICQIIKIHSLNENSNN